MTVTGYPNVFPNDSVSGEPRLSTLSNSKEATLPSSLLYHWTPSGLFPASRTLMTGSSDLLLQSPKCPRLYYSPSLLSLLLRLIKSYCFIFMITDSFHCLPYIQYLRHLYSFISITIIFSSNIFLWLLFVCSVSLLRLYFSAKTLFLIVPSMLIIISYWSFIFRLERKKRRYQH